MDIALLLVGLLLGSAACGWVILRLREQLVRAEAGALSDDRMLDAFRSLSQDALAAQSTQLVQLAEAKYGALHQSTDTALAGHSKVVGDRLQQLGERLADMERERHESTATLRSLVGELTVANRETQAEAAKLAAALADNRVRGAWGETQLRRVLELAGLQRHADFVEQRTVGDAEGKGRPDVIVPLAHGHCVVIDSKVPLDRYLEAANASDPEVERALRVEHAKAVAGHVVALARRDYVAKVEGAVDMVLMFLPGEPFLAAALDADPKLFESAAEKGVLLVTPSSILPVLRSIALGWREHRAEEAAAEIRQLGIELHERIAIFAEHHAAVGSQLDKAVSAFNRSVGSLDTRVLPTARKLADHGAGSSRALPAVVELATVSRPLRMLELVVSDGEEHEPEPGSVIAAGR